MKNHPQKLLRITQFHFFFLTAWAAQTAQTEEFMLQNVAYRPTVYRTGVPDWQHFGLILLPGLKTDNNGA